MGQELTDGPCFPGAAITVGSGTLDRAVQALDNVEARFARAFTTTVGYLRAPNWKIAVNPVPFSWQGGLLSFGEGDAAVTVSKNGDVYSILITVDGSTREVRVAPSQIGLPTDSAFVVNGSFTVPTNPPMTAADGAYTPGAFAGSVGSLSGGVRSGSGVLRAPIVSQLRSWRTYEYDGVIRNAELVSGTISGTRTGIASNPAGIFVATANLSLNTATITGSIILEGSARLTVAGDGAINPLPGYPAVVVGTGNLDIYSSGGPSRWTISGRAYCGGIVTDSGPVPSTKNYGRFYGGLVLGSLTPSIALPLKGAVTVNSSAASRSPSANNLIWNSLNDDPLMNAVL